MNVIVPTLIDKLRKINWKPKDIRRTQESKSRGKSEHMQSIQQAHDIINEIINLIFQDLIVIRSFVKLSVIVAAVTKVVTGHLCLPFNLLSPGLSACKVISPFFGVRISPCHDAVADLLTSRTAVIMN